MTNTGLHAKKELEILLNNKDSVLEEFKDEIISLCDRFGKSGQSGGSAPYVAKIISNSLEKLLLQETISPITGDESEWIDVAKLDGPYKGSPSKLYQNNRDGSIFKDGKDGKPYYIDAIVKKTAKGTCWSGSFWMSREDYLKGNKELMIKSKAYIKSFPFTPKTFYIDVIEEEVSKDNWEMYIKDPKQLDEVYKYYDKY